VLKMSNILHKTSLKIPKGLLDAVNRLKKKDKRTNNHHDLVDRYGISVSQMITDLFHLS
jgi:hypothetical protein